MQGHTVRVLPQRAIVALAIAFAASYAFPQAQTSAKKVTGIDDYTKWRSISGSELSGDGNWVTYVLQLTNTPTADAKPVLHLLKLETNEDVSVPNATGGAFSADSKWLAYQVDPSGGRGGRGGRGGAGADTPAPGAPAPATPPTTPPPDAPPTPDAPQTPTAPGAQQAGRGATTPPAPPRRVELRNLATGVVRSWQDIQTFTFSPASTHLILKRRPAGAAPTGGGRGAGAAAPAGPAPTSGGADATTGP